jgi:hypothetical protein
MLRRTFHRPTIGHSIDRRRNCRGHAARPDRLRGGGILGARPAVIVGRELGALFRSRLAAIDRCSSGRRLRRCGLPAKGSLERDLKASVIRLDEKGDIVWEAIVEGKRLYLFGGLSLTPRGELVLLGIRGGGADWALTLDASGKVKSEKSFGRPLVIFRHTVMLLDGGWASFGDDFTGGPPPRPTLCRFERHVPRQRRPVAPCRRRSPDATGHARRIERRCRRLGCAGRIASTAARDALRQHDLETHVGCHDRSGTRIGPGASIAAPLAGGSLAVSGMIGAYGRGAPWWVAVVGADGRTQWLSRVGRFEFVVPFALTGLADGAVVVGGCAIAKEGRKPAMPWLAILDAKGKLASESLIPAQNGGAVLALAPLPDGTFAAAGIGGNGCALIDAGNNGADTWVRVMRRQAIDRPR